MKKGDKVLLFMGVFMVCMMLYNVGANDIWFDTAFTIENSKRPLFDLLTDPQDVHPPLSYIVVKVWAWAYGYDIVSLRVLHIIFAVIGLLGASMLGKIHGCRKQMIAIFATSNLVFYYAREIRMYVMVLAILIWATVYFEMYIRTHSRQDFENAMLLGSVAVLFHYYAVFFLVWIYVYDAVRMKKLYIGFFGVLLWVYSFWYLFVQKSMIVRMWTKPVNANSYISAIRYVWNVPINIHPPDIFTWAIVPLVVVMLCIYGYQFVKGSRMKSYVFIAIGAPAFFMLLSLVTGAYHHRYLVMFAFAPMLVVANWISCRDDRKLQLFFVMLLGILFSVIAQPNTELSSANNYLRDSVGVDDIVLHENGFSYLPSRVYSPDLTHVVLSEYSREQLFSFGLVVWNESLVFYNQTAFNEFACVKGDVFYMKAELDYLPDSELVLELDGLNVTRQNGGELC